MMGLFEHWPYVNFHDLNLDWIIKEFPKVYASRDEAQASADASAESAAASQLSADASQQSADASQQSADASQQSADASQESAENAAEYEASAKNYADHIGDPVAGLVTDWLDDHVTPTTPIVDDTLTISGAAADAKKTGDEITNLSDGVEMLDVEMDYMQTNVLINPVNVTADYAQTNDQRFGVSGGGVVGTTSATGYKYRTGAVIPGHKYTVKSTVGNSLYGYALTDADNRVIKIDTQHVNPATFEDTFVCPVGASKIYINCLSQFSAIVTEHKSVDPRTLNTPYKYVLPAYYDTYLDDKIDDIHEYERDYGFNGATYAFITDFHYYANKQNSIPLLERIREKTNAVRLIYGGDSVRALGAEPYLLSDNYAVAALLASVYDTDYSYIFGNHDYTIATGSSWGEGMVSIPIAAVHSIYKKGFSTGIKRNYHYFDDEINEIRHIFIDYTQAGYPWFLEWFRDEALNIQSGWSVAFYCHTPFVANTVEAPSQYMSYLADWICAFANKRTYVQTITSTVGGTTYNTNINVDYTASTVTVIYAACGHIHKDTMSVVDGVTFFSTTCDAMFQDDGYDRTAGSTDEQAFDVITINKTTKTVNLVRIGAGNDRSFTYN